MKTTLANISKNVAVLAFTSVFLISFSGCGKNDDDNNGNVGSEGQKLSSEQKVKSLKLIGALKSAQSVGKGFQSSGSAKKVPTGRATTTTPGFDDLSAAVQNHQCTLSSAPSKSTSSTETNAASMSAGGSFSLGGEQCPIDFAMAVNVNADASQSQDASNANASFNMDMNYTAKTAAAKLYSDVDQFDYHMTTSMTIRGINNSQPTETTYGQSFDPQIDPTMDPNTYSINTLPTVNNHPAKPFDSMTMAVTEKGKAHSQSLGDFSVDGSISFNINDAQNFEMGMTYTVTSGDTKATLVLTVVSTNGVVASSMTLNGEVITEADLQLAGFGSASSAADTSSFSMPSFEPTSEYIDEEEVTSPVTETPEQDAPEEESPVVVPTYPSQPVTPENPVDNQEGEFIDKEFDFSEAFPDHFSNPEKTDFETKRLSEIGESELFYEFPMTEFGGKITLSPDSTMRAFASDFNSLRKHIQDMDKDQLIRLISTFAKDEMKYNDDQAKSFTEYFVNTNTELFESKKYFNVFKQVFKAEKNAGLDTKTSLTYGLQFSKEPEMKGYDKGACFVSALMDLKNNWYYYPDALVAAPKVERAAFAYRFASLGDYCAASTITFQRALPVVYKQNLTGTDLALLSNEQVVFLTFQMATLTQKAAIRTQVYLMVDKFAASSTSGPRRSAKEAARLALQVARSERPYDTMVKFINDYSAAILNGQRPFGAYITALRSNELLRFIK